MTTLPDPDCRRGYTYDQMEAILAGQTDAFGRWMRGQTLAFCDGIEYDYESKAHKPTGCGPHGPVVYGHDLRRFLANLAPLD
ncbi:hypothetical protein [Micromonospora sp. NPDC049891]|uniref:hypothetical protein n=1 Tax=Micromonospora sp. NPDC049891 TaxID=3155655 RepID=UPI0033CDE7E2